jgi:hypothetical protein
MIYQAQSGPALCSRLSEPNSSPVRQHWRPLAPIIAFTTPLYRRGELTADGTLHGDLILRAVGDPDLSGRTRSARWT